MLSCQQLAQQQASDYIDQQLPLRQRAAVLFHLLLCGDCRLFISQFRQLGRVVMQRPPERVDELIVQRLSEQLHALHAHSQQEVEGKKFPKI